MLLDSGSLIQVELVCIIFLVILEVGQEVEANVSCHFRILLV